MTDHGVVPVWEPVLDPVWRFSDPVYSSADDGYTFRAIRYINHCPACGHSSQFEYLIWGPYATLELAQARKQLIIDNDLIQFEWEAGKNAQRETTRNQETS